MPIDFTFLESKKKIFSDRNPFCIILGCPFVSTIGSY
jgi:hypothetical protein